MLRLLALTLLAALAGPTSLAAAARQTILAQRAPTEIKAYGGIALFSQWDGSNYQLAISQSGGPPASLAVPSQKMPFDADIGPDAQGRPVVVLSRCEAADCALFSMRIGDTAAKKLTATDDPAHPELHPTISGDQVAWVRRYRIGGRSVERVYTRSLAAPSTVRSTARPGVPRRGRVLGLKLSGRHLALSTLAPTDGSGVCGQREIRLVTLGRSSARVVASQLCGLDGQVYVGVSFSAGRLYYARVCFSGNCRGPQFGLLRYRIDNATYASSPETEPLEGFAIENDRRAYEVRRPEFGCGEEGGAPDPCTVVRVDGLRFVPLKR